MLRSYAAAFRNECAKIGSEVDQNIDWLKVLTCKYLCDCAESWAQYSICLPIVQISDIQYLHFRIYGLSRALRSKEAAFSVVWTLLFLPPVARPLTKGSASPHQSPRALEGLQIRTR